MTERKFNPIPKRFRPFVYGGLTIGGLAAAACGGGAKANNENPTQIPTQPVATEAPKPSSTPELSVEERLLKSTEVLPISDIRAITEAAFEKVIATSPDSRDIPSIRQMLNQGLAPLTDEKDSIQLQERINGLSPAVGDFGRKYCKYKQLPLLEAFVALRNKYIEIAKLAQKYVNPNFDPFRGNDLPCSVPTSGK